MKKKQKGVLFMKHRVDELVGYYAATSSLNWQNTAENTC